MWTDEELTELEEEEHYLTTEAIKYMVLVLHDVKGDLEKELRNFYQKYGRDGVVTYQEARKWVDEKDHRKRLFVLYAFMISRFSKALIDLEKEFGSMVNQIIAKESTFFDSELKDTLSLKWGVDDLDWLERLKDDVELWQSQLNIDWKRSLLQRKHIDKVLEELDSRFDSIASVLEKLTLTESTAIGSIARKQILKDLGYTKYRFYSRPDERRCDVCGALHGLVFPMSAYEVGATASPLHPRCRCWEVPIKD